MPARKSKKWQSRRKPSLGQLRRAHPASGATWNVQVVRGKMTSKCLWHACRALVLGILLMLLGASMATVGYYADHLSMGHEIRGNATVRVKNESRGFHLNNLSYVGPIVMGFGGFIVVAACVMTFEARDSAAKVVPARFKISTSSRSNIRSNSSSGASNRRANGIMHQATRWDHHLGVFRTSPAEPPAPAPAIDRQALTAALIHFSKTLGNSPRQSPKSRRFPLSGSVPNLSSALTSNRSSINSAQLSPLYRRQLLNNYNMNPNSSLTLKQLAFQQFQQQQHHQLLLLQQHKSHHKSKSHHHNHHHRHHHHNVNDISNGDDLGNKAAIGGASSSGTKHNDSNNNSASGGVAFGINGTSTSRDISRKSRTQITSINGMEHPQFTKSRTGRTSTSLIHRTSRKTCGDSSGSLLHPGKLHQMHRHAMSVDESGPYYNAHGSDFDDSSLMSIIMLEASHEQRIRERNIRSDTAKRHILARQKPIEREELLNQQNAMAATVAAAARLEQRRRSSTTSDASNASRYYRAPSSATSRTNSIDSRSIQVEMHSPEQQQQHYHHYYANRTSPRTPRRQSSTPSVERSQISVCSEPGSTVIRQMSGQSSLEPCVLEESPESPEDKNKSADQMPTRMESPTTSSKIIHPLNTISASIKQSSPKSKSKNPCDSPIYCNIKKQRPQSLKISSSNNFQVRKNTKQPPAIEEKPQPMAAKSVSLQRSNSSRTFYRAKPKSIREYETINRSTEDSASVSGYYNYYNSSGVGDSTSDFYDSLRVINERRNKILKTESESNSQQQQTKQTETNEIACHEGSAVLPSDVEENAAATAVSKTNFKRGSHGAIQIEKASVGIAEALPDLVPANNNNNSNINAPPWVSSGSTSNSNNNNCDTNTIKCSIAYADASVSSFGTTAQISVNAQQPVDHNRIEGYAGSVLALPSTPPAAKYPTEHEHVMICRNSSKDNDDETNYLNAVVAVDSLIHVIPIKEIDYANDTTTDVTDDAIACISNNNKVLTNNQMIIDIDVNDDSNCIDVEESNAAANANRSNSCNRSQNNINRLECGHQDTRITINKNAN